jgi:hypothetical protein
MIGRLNRDIEAVRAYRHAKQKLMDHLIEQQKSRWSRIDEPRRK